MQRHSNTSGSTGQRPLVPFDALYIINLPSRPDRRKEMIEQLKLADIEAGDPRVCFFNAVRPVEKAGFPTVGTRGCFLSHLGVLKLAQQAGHRTILLLEDDTNFAIRSPEDLEVLGRQLGEREWDFVYPGFLSITPATELTSALSVVDPASSVMGAHMMLIRSTVFATLIAYLEDMLTRPTGSAEGGPMHVDGAYSWFRREHPSLTTLVCSPQLGYQRPSRTDIHRLQWFDRTPVVRSIVQRLRRARAKSRV